MINKIVETQILNMKAGKEIDQMVAEKIFGEKFIKPTHGTCCTCQICGWNYEDCVCGWSTYLEQAWQVLEKMGNKFYVDSTAPDLGIDVAIFVGDKMYKATGETFELAVCKAALLAKFSE